MPKFLNLIQYEDDGKTTAVDNTGTLKTIKISPENIAGTTIQRDENGRAKIVTPVDDLDIANKSYTDTVGSDTLASAKSYTDENFDLLNIKNGTGYGSLKQRTSNLATGLNAVAFGGATSATNFNSFACGDHTTASGNTSFSEGIETTAKGDYSHAEGYKTNALMTCSHSEGGETNSTGGYSHAEGYKTIASGGGSHAEGSETTASGEIGSHAEGYGTVARGITSHAEGYQTAASHTASHAGGNLTQTGADNQTVIGYCNVGKANTYFEVGNGASSDKRQNAFEVLFDGRAKVQSSPTENDDVVRKAELDIKLDAPDFTTPPYQAITFDPSGNVTTKEIYPVGSIFTSATFITVDSLKKQLGGTWTLLHNFERIEFVKREGSDKIAKDETSVLIDFNIPEDMTLFSIVASVYTNYSGSSYNAIPCLVEILDTTGYVEKTYDERITAGSSIVSLPVSNMTLLKNQSIRVKTANWIYDTVGTFYAELTFCYLKTEGYIYKKTAIW